MQIKLSNIHFTDVQFKVESLTKDISNELETSLIFQPIFNPEIENEYILEFILELKNSNPVFNLNLRSSASFSTTEPINDEFMNSPFIKINSPAIAFPYIRAFISNLTLNCGYNPIVLPTFNFVKIAEDKK